MTFNEKHLVDGEHIITKFRPHWRLLFVPLGWVLLAIVAWWIIHGPLDLNAQASWILSALVLVALIPLTLAPLVTWWFTTYILTNTRLVTRSGVVSRHGVEIPLENINNVIFHQSFIERILKSGDLLVESAGETGQSRFRSIPQPEEFQALLHKARQERAKSLVEPSTPGSSDVTTQLSRLAELHRDGVLTDEEFAEKKQRLLDQI